MSAGPVGRPIIRWTSGSGWQLASILHYFEQNAHRMRYGTYRCRGYFIGSGAIESAGKQTAAARIKGPGMRWNVADLNALLVLRCVF